MKKLFVLAAILVPFLSPAQNVGIGTNSPGSTLTINATDPVIGLLNNGIGHSYIQAYGSNMNIGTHPDNPVGDIVFQPRGIDRVWIDENGQVGIGTATPSSLLTINGTNPLLQMRHSNSNKGFIQALGNDLKLGTNSTNTTGTLVFQTKQLDRMMIDENGQVGIGTIAPVSALTINGTNPYIEMQNANVNTGFLQASGVNIKMGTNSTNTTGKLILQTKLVDRLTIDENGQVGIGTNSPSSVLTINDVNPIVQLRNNFVDKGYIQLVGDDIKIGTNLTNNLGRFVIRTNGGDRVAVTNDGRLTVNTSGIIGSAALSIGDNNGHNAGIDFVTSNDFYGYINFGSTSASIHGDRGDMTINTVGNGIRLHSDGNITMGGSQKATGYFLSVHGKIIGTAVTALAVNSWPDYVFEKDYSLRPLSELKKFIDDNKHLPGIPSAAEIEKKGVELGDISKRLMEKIEELTLYIIQQQEQIEELKRHADMKKEK